MTQTTKLIILDRDGVINLDSDDYIKSPEEWIAIQSSLKAVAILNRAGYKVGVATNQSGISRGYFDEVTLAMMHKKMEMELARVGAHIDALEYCSDHPDQPGPNRKPNPGMPNKLIEMFEANPAQTWFVGDSLSDIKCAINAGCKPVLVLTGKGQRTLEKGGLPQNLPIYDNLKSFVDENIAID
ncbi:D-glycero-beta-D-manno-heptose 1,7-bisphosphate 7-phosphatase [Aliikangiella coralliicola]|uniref:D,D-heptose 1,7-bisphosphate phosphatase n=1 Tax=Aliikangiella coralliicola TaxID=2592383 RepID=A0A545UGF6_9GAMM|nr:D-glycero-beta-D-manno-heptose 1,7-bisphosphate 7-phosphatase [Aliikangiella coralliicola]TQV88549.1 D-glycero-beta-D-manno-heptose 1,7-bisphosphate 7-phosphatase [Aliikangiella coralliicola]